MTIQEAKAVLRPLGVTLRHDRGEFRVNLREASEATAYYTTDIRDAVDTGKAMADPSGDGVCGSGWTGDRCSKLLGHLGPHSNDGPEDDARRARRG